MPKCGSASPERPSKIASSNSNPSSTSSSLPTASRGPFSESSSSIPSKNPQDPDKKLLLSRLIKPFILRRKKAKCSSSFPKRSKRSPTAPSPTSKKSSTAIAFLTAETVSRRAARPQESPSRIVHVFSLLSTLKQICDHPCLVNRDTKIFRNTSRANGTSSSSCSTRSATADKKSSSFPSISTCSTSSKPT